MIFIVIWLTVHYGIMGLGFGGLLWLGSLAWFESRLDKWEYRRFLKSGGQPWVQPEHQEPGRVRHWW